MLEKRVASRLNAQYVYMKQPSGENVCNLLMNRLQLDANHPKLAHLSRKQIDRYNNSVKSLFSPESGRMRALISAYVDHGRGWDFFLRAAQMCVAQMFVVNIDNPHSKNKSSGDIGENEYFSIFTASDYALALGDLTPPSLADTMQCLSSNELTMFAALVRLVGRQASANVGLTVGGGLSVQLPSSSSSSSSSSSTSSSAVMAASDAVTLRVLLLEFRKLITRKDLSDSQLINTVRSLNMLGLIQVSNPSMKQIGSSNIYKDETNIYMVPSLQESCDVFSGEIANKVDEAILVLKNGIVGTCGRNDFNNDLANDSSLKLMYYHRNSVGRIRVSDVVRRAVAEPLEPIATSTSTGTLR